MIFRVDSKAPVTVKWRTSRTFRGLIYGLAALLAVFAGGMGLVNTAWFERALQQAMKSSLSELTGARVEMRSVRFNPFILQIAIQGLTLHGTESATEPPVFISKKVVARLSIVPLARRKLRFRSMDWEQARVHLVTYPDGLTNLPGPQGPWSAERAAEELLDLRIGQLTCGDTQIEWNDRRVPVEFQARDIAILLRRIGARQYKGSLAFTATNIRAPIGSLPPAKLTSQFELSPAGMSIKLFTWQSAGLIGRGSMELRDFASPHGSFSARGNLQFQELTERLGMRNLKGGTLNFDGGGEFGPGSVQAKGRLRGLGIIIQAPEVDVGPVDFSASYALDNHHALLTDFAATAPVGEAQGQAEILFDKTRPEGSLQARLIGVGFGAALRSFPRARPLLGRLPFATKIDGRIQVAWGGPREDIRSDFNLLFHPAGATRAGTVPLTGSARGQVTAGSSFRMDVTSARFETPHSTLSVEGSLGAPASKLSFNWAASDFEEWRPLFEYLTSASRPIPLVLDSVAEFSGTASGPFSRPVIQGTLLTGKLRYAGLRWEGFKASVAATTDSIQISSGQIQEAAGSLALEAYARLERGMLIPRSQVRLTLRASRSPLQGLIAAANRDTPSSGLVSGELNLEGTRERLAGQGFVKLEQGQLARVPFEVVTAEIKVSGSGVELQQVQLRYGGGQLAGYLQFDSSSRSFRSEFRGSDLSLSEFWAPTSKGSTSHEPTWLEGLAGIEFRAEGVPGDLRLHSVLNVRDLRMNAVGVGDFSVEVNWDGRWMQFQGGSRVPSELLRFHGEARTEDFWPCELTAQYKNFPVAPVLGILFKRQPNVVASADGILRITGPLKIPERLEFHDRTNKLEVSFPTIAWKNEQPIELRYTSGELTAGRFRMRGPSTDLEVEGTVRFGSSAALSVDVLGEADAALLKLIDPALETHGRSDLKLRVTGAPAQPLLEGTLDVHEVSFGYSDLPVRVTGLNGQVRLEGGRAVVQSLRGTGGGGSVTLTGSVTLGTMPRYDLRVDLDQVHVPYPSDFTALISGILRLAGIPERGQLSGEVKVRQLSARGDLEVVSRMLEGSVPLKERLSGLASPLAPNIRLDVQVTSASPLRVETRDLRVLADADLRIQGTLASPLGIGSIHFRSGEALFRGNRYTLARGEIRMSNPIRSQPLLDLEAQTRVQHYDVTLDITGPLDHLKVAYRSDPPLPTMDILYLLALGYSRQQTEMSTSVARPLPAVEAGALLSEALSNQVAGRMQRLFGVSRIKIDPNVVGPGNSAGARITVEQQVTRDLTLTYATNTATSQYRVIQFEWAVSENASLIGVRDQNGIFGMELKFRKRFK